MTIFGIAMVRNEADIIEPIIKHMLTQVDEILVADNMSTDGTLEILESLPVEVFTDSQAGYYQSQKMSMMADATQRRGAEWVVPFDADEVWLTRSGQRIADELADLPEAVLVAEADLWDHVSTGHDPKEPNPLKRIQWRRDKALPLPKIACRAKEGMIIQQGNHSVSYPSNPFPATVRNLLTVRHFPYRSPEQFIAKVRQGAAAYKATDLPESMGAHWRQWGQILETQGEAAVASIYRKWFFREYGNEPVYIEGEFQFPLVYDPVPMLES
jgi:glycosyltransferase involved in cell wall biosynthesis